MASKTISTADQAKYVPIIDAIFASSDLSVVSVKVVRQGLERRLGLDLSEQKSEINNLIKTRFDKALEEQDTGEPNGEHTVDGSVADPDNEEAVVDEPYTTSQAGSASPVVNNKKRKSPSTDNDAKLAAQLQAQLNAAGRTTRNTRNKPAKQKKPVVKGKKAKKSADVVTSDLSDAGGAGKPEKKRRKPNNAFNKPMLLAEPLAALVGDNQMSRPECVKRIWAHVKAHELQDPNDKRNILCDEMMRPVFGNKVNMFTMNKVLSGFMFKQDDVVDPGPIKSEEVEVRPDHIKSEMKVEDD